MFYAQRICLVFRACKTVLFAVGINVPTQQNIPFWFNKKCYKMLVLTVSGICVSHLMANSLLLPVATEFWYTMQMMATLYNH